MYLNDDEKKTVVWIQKQRRNYYEEKLSNEQIQLLDELNMDWTKKKYKGRNCYIEITPNVSQGVSAG